MGDEFASWQADATPERKSVSVCLDRRLLSEIEDLRGRLEEVALPPKARTLGIPDDVEALQARLRELEAEASGKARTLVFESIGRRAWRALLGAHPPTAEQREQFGTLLDHNPETFPAAALSASCVEPELSPEQAKWIVDELPVGVVDRIWATCLSANVTGSTDPFAGASDGARAGARK